MAKRGDSLKPYRYTSDQDRLQASINGRKGGLAVQEKRRKMKTMREIINKYLSFRVTDEKTKKELLKVGFTQEELNNKTAFVLAMFKNATIGEDSKFAKIITDLAQENDELETRKKRLKLENELLKLQIEQQRMKNESYRKMLDGNHDIENLIPIADAIAIKESEINAFNEQHNLKGYCSLEDKESTNDNSESESEEEIKESE